MNSIKYRMSSFDISINDNDSVLSNELNNAKNIKNNIINIQSKFKSHIK